MWCSNVMWCDTVQCDVMGFDVFVTIFYIVYFYFIHSGDSKIRCCLPWIQQVVVSKKGTVNQDVDFLELSDQT